MMNAKFFARLLGWAMGATLLPASPLAAQDATTFVRLGATVTLTANADGTAPLQYQWTFADQPLPGATNASLALERFSSRQAGRYGVRVVNSLGSAVAEPVVLALDASSLLPLAALPERVVAGGTLALSAALPAPADARWQWLRDGQPIAGATSSVLLVRPAATAVYQLRLTAGGREEFSAEVTPRSGTAPRGLANLSTRGMVSPEGPLIGGVVIPPDWSRTLLIRAVGPGLGAFGVANPLAQPAVRLRDATGRLLATEAAWSGAARSLLADAAAAVGAFPLTAAADAAILLTLPPGAYTVEVAALGSSRGEALLEVYDVP
jgi:hypothetical protein